jgi:hypothetical protein
MSSSVIQYAPATLLFPPAEKKKRAFSIPRTKASHSRPNPEPETRFWKLAGRPVSRIRTSVESVILAVFFLAALVAVTDGFVALSHLLQTDSVEHVAAKAINGDA